MLNTRETKRLVKLMRDASNCGSYGESVDPECVAVGFFFYGEHAIENAREVCALLNKLGGKDDARN